MRHFYASVAVVLGEPLPVVGKLLGHARTATTDRYAHLADDPLRDASQRIGTRLEEMLLNGPEDSQAQKLDVFQHKSVRRKV